jgi:hypothetical protein
MDLGNSKKRGLAPCYEEIILQDIPKRVKGSTYTQKVIGYYHNRFTLFFFFTFLVSIFGSCPLFFIIHITQADDWSLVELFFNTISQLSEWKKNIIRKLGFGSLLEFSCYSSINDIFLWLVDHVDADSGQLTLEHGFTFSFSADVINIILGLPRGNKPVNTKVTKEACEIIHETVQSEYPSVHYLCDMLSQLGDDDEIAFSRIFMLASLSAFAAPNGRGDVSIRYYQAVIDYVSDRDHDWCSFTLYWLMSSIKTFKSNKAQGFLSNCGGCNIVPVVSDFFTV